jgi:hypothetical protein
MRRPGSLIGQEKEGLPTLSVGDREESDSAEALEGDTERLRAIGIELDVCWDLLRQRRALRDAGVNPDHAKARDPDTVERYWQ